MSAYNTMLTTNYRMITHEPITDRVTVVGSLLSAKAANNAAEAHTPTADKREMYPLFFIPPENGGKTFKTLLGQTPKTQILSANMYELEILRLLAVLAPEDAEITHMVARTLERLKTTCFGYCDDGVGECFDTSLIVLRFLAAAAPSETAWIRSRIDNYKAHCDEKKRTSFSWWYYWLCLSELPFETVRGEIDRCRDELLYRLADRSYVMNSEHDRTLHPVILCILRNLLANYPEYSHIKERLPFLSKRDNRLHFSIEKEQV